MEETAFGGQGSVALSCYELNRLYRLNCQMILLIKTINTHEEKINWKEIGGYEFPTPK